MSKCYIVTGTDTGVGKTVVAAGLSAALGAQYWKPIQAGLDERTDTDVVTELAGGPVRTIPEAYCLGTPCSPHEAARLDGLTIESSQLHLPKVAGPLIIEGAGGVMVPINEQQLMIDLFAMWARPVILVACTTLGTINHSLLSIAALRSRDLEIAGIIFVGGPNASSEIAIIERGGVAHLGRLPWIAPLDAAGLSSAMQSNIKFDRLR